MKPRIAVLLVAASLLAWGCGSDGGSTASPSASSSASSSPSTSASPTPRPTASPTPSSTPAARTVVGVYLVLHEHVQPVARTVTGVSVGAGAVQALLAGPTSAERAAGFSSAVPAGTAFLDLDIAGGLATVDLSGRFASGGGSLSMQLRAAQLVHTLTRLPSVTKVALRLDGRPVTALGGEGVDVSPPMTRARFEDQAPAILVEEPLRGTRVSSPLVVSGTANVFEAQFSAELRVAGRVVAAVPVRASAGTGTRGTFTVRMSYRLSTASKGTLVVFDRSEKDGHRIDVVTVPLLLAAG